MFRPRRLRGARSPIPGVISHETKTSWLHDRRASGGGLDHRPAHRQATLLPDGIVREIEMLKSRMLFECRGEGRATNRPNIIDLQVKPS